MNITWMIQAFLALLMTVIGKILVGHGINPIDVFIWYTIGVNGVYAIIHSVTEWRLNNVFKPLLWFGVCDGFYILVFFLSIRFGFFAAVATFVVGGILAIKTLLCRAEMVKHLEYNDIFTLVAASVAGRLGWGLVVGLYQLLSLCSPTQPNTSAFAANASYGEVALLGLMVFLGVFFEFFRVLYIRQKAKDHRG